jgi:hypothetical protein
MQTVSRSQVETGIERIEEPLSPHVQEALGQLVGQRRRDCSRSAWASGSACLGS